MESQDTATVEMAAGSIAGPPDIGQDNDGQQLPAWLANADAEETRELEALGVVVDPQFAEDAHRDVLISTLLRASHEHEADVVRYDTAEKLEHAQITRRYDLLRSPALRQLSRLTSFLHHIISTVQFTGRAKSRSVGWGSYGLRKERDKVEITNQLEVVQAVRTIDPDAVIVTVTTTAFVQAQADVLLSQLITASQTQPLSGSDAGVLSALRAALRAGAPEVSKTIVGRLLKEEKPAPDGQTGTVPAHHIPGAAIMIGTDKPWFEVEPPANG